jgi:hypothetical protein
MDGHIVLVHPNNLNDCIEQVHHSIIICLEKPDAVPDSLDNDLIVLDDPISSQLILNILTSILDSFSEWDLHLREALYKTMSFQDITDLISQMLETPVSLINQDFRYIAYSKLEGGKHEKFVDEQNQLPLEDATMLLSRPDFKQLELIHEAFSYVAAESVVYKNIYYRQQYVGRLGVLIDEHIDEEYCKAIFDYAAFYIEALYAHSQSFDVTPLKLAKIHEFLAMIFNKEWVDADAFQKTLTENHAEPNDIYAVLCLTSNNIARATFSFTYLCSKVEQMWTGIYCIHRGEQIIILSNRSLLARNGHLDFHQELIYFIRDALLLAGISREFSDISCLNNISNAYLQANYALETGRVKKPEHWYHYFNDYALDYLLQNGCAPFRPDQVCHPALLQLLKHDRENGTSFTKTLFTYVRLRFNAVASAKALFIHRSSFINRMERIQELVQINWDDINERVYLLLSFKLLKISYED